MPKPNNKEWSNEVSKDDLDQEMKTPTPRELELAEAAAKASADAPPQLYDVTSKNKTAMRVIHDHRGNPVHIEPEKTRRRVLLRPSTAAFLGKGDLELTPSVEVPAEPTAA